MARETKGSGDKGFPVLFSGTFALHLCGREVSIYCMGESWGFLLPLKISLFQRSKIPCPQSPSFLVPSPAKRSEREYLDENEEISPS